MLKKKTNFTFCLKLFLCNSREKQQNHSSTLITNREPCLQWKNLIKKSGNGTLLVTLADKAVPFAENGSLTDTTFSQRNPAFIEKMIKHQAAALGGSDRLLTGHQEKGILCSFCSTQRLTGQRPDPIAPGAQKSLQRYLPLRAVRYFPKKLPDLLLSLPCLFLGNSLVTVSTWPVPGTEQPLPL